jgi:HPr kinase/phosphorylase
MIHGTCVALNGRAVLLTGASGQGKSGLALQLMAFGCQLVADDRTILTVNDGKLIASCPPAIAGQIEARFVGILCAEPVPDAELVLVVDMDRTEEVRLPEPRSFCVLNVSLPLLHNVRQAHFPAAILQYLRSGAVYLND